MKLGFVKNFNKRKGKSLYVVFDSEKDPLNDWVGRIMWNNREWIFEVEKKLIFNVDDLKKIAEFMEGLE